METLKFSLEFCCTLDGSCCRTSNTYARFQLFSPSSHGAAEEQMSKELEETVPQPPVTTNGLSHQDDSPMSVMNCRNKAESDKLLAIPVGFVGSEEVVRSAPHLVPGGNLNCPSLEEQGMRINAALDAAHAPISHLSNLIDDGHRAANFRGPFQPSDFYWLEA